MNRKNKIAIAVQTYKSKLKEKQEALKHSRKNVNETKSEEIKEVNKLNNNQVNEVVPVKSLKTVLDSVEDSHIDEFVLFLNQMKDSRIKNDNRDNNKNNEVTEPDANNIIRKNSPPAVVALHTDNQHNDLFRFPDLVGSSKAEESSEMWLKYHNLDVLTLTIEDLIHKGKLAQPKEDLEIAEQLNCLIFDDLTVTDFEYKVNLAIEMYGKRVRWCLQGSRKIFGFVAGSRIGVIVDCSNVNLALGRLIPFQDNLLRLLEEQLFKKKSMNIGFFGTDVYFLWEKPMNLNCKIFDEVKVTLMRLSPTGGCNLLQAIKQVVYDRSIDRVVLIIGSCPDQSVTLLLDFVQQLLLSRNLPFHCVSYESQSEEVNTILENIANFSNGNFHRYSSLSEELMYTSNDIDLLLQEIERAQHVLSKINLMRKGLFTNRVTNYVDQMADELLNVSKSELEPKKSSANEQLAFESSKFDPTSSSEWVTTKGLKPKKIGLLSRKVLRAQTAKALSVSDYGVICTD